MKLSHGSPMQQLFDTLPQQGKVVWIGIRPERKLPLISVPSVEAITNKKLKGDHYTGGSKRQVTLIQSEHLEAVSSFMEMETLSPELVRRNIVVNGINLLAL